MSKRILKYIVYFDKTFFGLSETTVSISIASFATVIGAPLGMASARLSLSLSISSGIVKDC